MIGVRYMVAQFLRVLDRVLSERAWILGEHFTVGDLNVAGVLSPSRSVEMPERCRVVATLLRKTCRD